MITDWVTMRPMNGRKGENVESIFPRSISFDIPDSGYDIYLLGYFEVYLCQHYKMAKQSPEDLTAEFSTAFYGHVGFKCTGHTSSYKQIGEYCGKTSVRDKI